MAQAMKLMAEGVQVAIVGGAKSMKTLAEAAGELQDGNGTGHPMLFAFKTWAEVQEHVESDDADAELRVLVELVDEHGYEAIVAAAEGMADEKKAQTILSTPWRTKGREWDTVRVAGFREPRRNPNRTYHTPIPRDLGMVLYVAVTRAKLGLDDRDVAWGARLLAEAA
jgi:superfamily I DNA/RNA helicase